MPTRIDDPAHSATKVIAGRCLAQEVAVAISYNATTQAVMMASPIDLEDFAYGFSLTEGLAGRDEIEAVETVKVPRGIDLRIWVTPAANARLAARRRMMTGPVGCGLCGIDTLEQAMRSMPPVTADVRITPEQIHQAMRDLPKHQPLHDATRAAHAAGAWDPERGIIAVREDVGRHNALDKLAGALSLGQTPPSAILLTSRLSLDLIQKVAAIGAPVVVAVSSPTEHAVTLANELGITLIGQARRDGFHCFTHPTRLVER
ncbi:formate dehydrogenase accessory sulfurtransferase FdhD [Falsirhodobacter sp. alg1]|uniref:formate dehydrogenase accessory sulfurtransferase FdhD n=1 Tax=Falsirhodobacter sp. alg1 TaxID=1472418 RepID=UPI0005F0AB55|nr:formate dehydrogenase accessory sulfurtransferase FdhD [Falsirhodobacter sp. alg1]